MKSKGGRAVAFRKRDFLRLTACAQAARWYARDVEPRDPEFARKIARAAGTVERLCRDMMRRNVEVANG